MAKAKRKQKREKTVISNLMLNNFIPDAILDFHDKGVLNAYEVEKFLNEFIEDSIIAEYKNIIIVTGKGQFVRPLVRKLLKVNKSIKKFNRAGYFNGQDGAFEVEI